MGHTTVDLMTVDTMTVDMMVDTVIGSVHGAELTTIPVIPITTTTGATTAGTTITGTIHSRTTITITNGRTHTRPSITHHRLSITHHRLSITVIPGILRSTIPGTGKAGIERWLWSEQPTILFYS